MIQALPTSRLTTLPGRQAGGRNKWEELRVEEMSLPFDIWEIAVKRIDKDPSRVKKGLADTGYRVPEPAIIISGQTSERRQLFLTNWLTIRPLWISRLEHNPPAQFPSPQLWRDILNSLPSKVELQTAPESGQGNKTAKSRKLAALGILGEDVASLTQISSSGPSQRVEWRGKCIPIDSLSNPPPRLVRAILWEVYEIGFRYELCALDKILNPQQWAISSRERSSFICAMFPGSSGLVLWSEPLPTQAGDLGLTDSFPDNIRVLRTFCLLLSTWPNAHPSFSDLPSGDVGAQSKLVQFYEVTSRACQFYVQTFFDHFGRPPLLPHHFPFEYHE